ncbi:MAG: hypothetical protein ACWA5L_00700 [bacterium]
MGKIAALIIALGAGGAALWGTKDITGLSNYLPEHYFGLASTQELAQLPAPSTRMEQADVQFIPQQDIKFCIPWQGNGEECLTREELRAMADKPLMRHKPALIMGQKEGPLEALSVELVHPTDYSVDPKTVTTCTEYNLLKQEGWGGLTSRDMARERQFILRCGLFAIAESAQIPEQSNFNEGRLNEQVMSAIPEQDWPQIGEPKYGTPLKFKRASLSRLEKASDRYHVVQYGNVKTVISEVAHADFNADGWGDILVLLSGRPADGGTARFTLYCIVENKNGAISMTPVNVY